MDADVKGENERNECEYFLKHKENDKNIFYLRGEILFCARPECEYGNQVGNFLFEEETPEVRACKTNGLKKTEINEEEFKKKLEKVVEEIGVCWIELKKTKD